MYSIVRFIGDFLVLLIVAFPPFMYLHNYIRDKVKNALLVIVIYIAYWGSTLILSSLLPSMAVLFVIWRAKKENAYSTRCLEDESGNIQQRKFRLDCSNPEWDFSLRLFAKVSLLGIPIKYAVTIANYFILEVFSGVIEKYNISLENQEIVNEFLKTGWWKGAFYIILIVICAPIVEEFVFRFWIYDRLLKNRIGSLLSALFSSLLFMTAHFNIQGAVAFFLVGMINCFLYNKKGYWAAVANHFMFNFSSVILLIILKLLNIPLDT